LHAVPGLSGIRGRGRDDSAVSKPNLRPVRSAVVTAGVVTLIVTLARLWGELRGFDPKWFSNEAGGGLAFLGIVWLVPIFGFWFGRRLAAVGSRPRSVGSAFVLALLGLAALVGGAGYAGGSLEGEELRSAMLYITVGGPLLSLFALAAWPRAFAVNLVYAIFARVPVVLVQYLAIAKDWGTHYEKVHPKLPPMTPYERAFGLMLAQTTLWIPFTILLGTVFAALGAATRRAR
jgi:hypothetical protein